MESFWAQVQNPSKSLDIHIGRLIQRILLNYKGTSL